MTASDRSTAPSWRDVVTALPDLTLGASFLVTWIAPDALGEQMVRHCMLVMLLEFIIIHSAAFMGMVAFAPRLGRREIRALLGLTGVYSLFAGGFALAFRTWWPLFAFWGLTVNRLLGPLIGEVPSGTEQGLIRRGWGATGVFYLLFIFLTTLAPIPPLGITSAVIRRQDLPSDGSWVDEPYRMIACGFLYFTAVGISELFAHRWVGNPPVPDHSAR